MNFNFYTISATDMNTIPSIYFVAPERDEDTKRLMEKKSAVFMEMLLHLIRWFPNHFINFFVVYFISIAHFIATAAGLLFAPSNRFDRQYF